MSNVIVAEGTEVVSFRTVPAPSRYGVCRGVAVYRATRRKSDRVMTWRMIAHVGGYVRGRNGAQYPAGRWTEAAAARDAEAHAEKTGRRFVYGVRHGQAVYAAYAPADPAAAELMLTNE